MRGNLTLPQGHCGDDGHTTVHVQLRLSGDGVADNNMVKFQYPCSTGRCSIYVGIHHLYNQVFCDKMIIFKTCEIDFCIFLYFNLITRSSSVD